MKGQNVSTTEQSNTALSYTLENSKRKQSMASLMEGESERKVYANMTNHTSTEMTFEWYLNFTKDPCLGVFNIIPPGETLFLDRVMVKGAVVYSGYNKENNHCAWLLAWNGPVTHGDLSVRKVYVTCGLKSVIAKMTPEEIEKNLDNGSSFAVATDSTTKTTVNAGIIGAVPNDSASVSANFGLVD